MQTYHNSKQNCHRMQNSIENTVNTASKVHISWWSHHISYTQKVKWASHLWFNTEPSRMKVSVGRYCISFALKNWESLFLFHRENQHLLCSILGIEFVLFETTAAKQSRTLNIRLEILSEKLLKRQYSEREETESV